MFAVECQKPKPGAGERSASTKVFFLCLFFAHIDQRSSFCVYTELGPANTNRLAVHVLVPLDYRRNHAEPTSKRGKFLGICDPKLVERWNSARLEFDGQGIARSVCLSRSSTPPVHDSMIPHLREKEKEKERERGGGEEGGRQRSRIEHPISTRFNKPL